MDGPTPHSAAARVDDDLVQRLSELNEVGVALSRERDLNRLLETILEAAQRLTRADGGTLYRRRVADPNALDFEIVRNGTLGIALGGSTGAPAKFDPILLRDAAGRENTSMVVAYAVLRDCTVNIADVAQAQGFDFSGTRAFDQRMGYRSQSFLTVPLKDHEGEIIGVLQLINAREPGTHRIVAFSEAERRLVESLASQAAVAITNRLLLVQLERLFESFIALINEAIDDKSPYTGGHCKRVPELTMLLAEAAHRAANGPFADWTMSDRDRYELKIAALLHDCGKITTPTHVVDKATKLQTIYDRIGLINTRFEVVRRDAEIAMLRAAAEPGADRTRLEAEWRARQEEISADQLFLQKCNFGSEAMAPADQERVRAISRRYAASAPGETGFLTEEEIYNLTIRAGTLTPEERKVINRHVEVSIKMLEALPWPRHLKRVPEFAGGHHERMDGKGYPRGLTRDQMSVQARIMGIADIFEALTAGDRPYKRGMKLTEALQILGQMSVSGHIDPDLFDLFVRERVYEKYAAHYLSPAQLDDVRVERIPGYRGT